MKRQIFGGFASKCQKCDAPFSSCPPKMSSKNPSVLPVPGFMVEAPQRGSLVLRWVLVEPKSVFTGGPSSRMLGPVNNAYGHLPLGMALFPYSKFPQGNFWFSNRLPNHLLAAIAIYTPINSD